MKLLANYIKLLRLHQWVKNLFIFAPLFFAFKFSDPGVIIKLAFAFIGFSFIASSIYIINDWCDIESDRLHPKKKYRPLASGVVSKIEALILFVILVVVGISIFCYLDNIFSLVLVAGYFVLNLAYSFKLKQYAIIDVAIVAIGFVVRLFIGGLIADVYLSYWIIILTFLLALLLVLGKRLNDVTILSETGQQMRKSILGYNAEFLNAVIVIDVAVIIISYIMYTISPEAVARNGEYLYLTSIFVMLGLFRYLQVLYVKKKGDSPTKLVFTDRFLQLDILLWALSFVLLHLYEHSFKIN